MIHNDCEQTVERTKPTICHDAGVCLCSPEGKALRHMGNRLLEVVREVCPHTNTALRAELSGCCLEHCDRCRREKVSHGGRGAGQGRPLGYLVAWLQRGAQHESQRAHMEEETTIDLESRRAGRLWLRAFPSSAPLFAGERPLRDGEEDGPVEHP